jgi:hypothetical protein
MVTNLKIEKRGDEILIGHCCFGVAHGQWFSPGPPASSTTKTGHHDIHVAEILLKVALNTINHIKSDIDNM